MARVHVPITVLNDAGEPVSGASVTIRKRSDNSLVDLYATETGGSAVANPASTDATGRIDRWMDRQAVKMTVTATGLTTYDEYWDGVPAGDGTIDQAFLGNGIVSTSKLTANALNTFLKLKLEADRNVAFGTGTITFSGVAIAGVSVAHGLGATPALILGTPKFGGSITNPESYRFGVTVADATNFSMSSQAPATVTGTLAFYWLAIA